MQVIDDILTHFAYDLATKSNNYYFLSFLKAFSIIFPVFSTLADSKETYESWYEEINATFWKYLMLGSLESLYKNVFYSCMLSTIASCDML